MRGEFKCNHGSCSFSVKDLDWPEDPNGNALVSTSYLKRDKDGNYPEWYEQVTLHHVSTSQPDKHLEGGEVIPLSGHHIGKITFFGGGEQDVIFGRLGIYFQNR